MILGGGFAGVQAAIELTRRRRFEVTLVSDRDFLYLFPVSIWLPTHGISQERSRVPLADIQRAHGFAVVRSAVLEIDADRAMVVCADQKLTYDYLIIALGADKVAHPGLEHTLSICGKPEAALEIRDRVDELVARGSGRIAVGFGGNPKDASGVRGGPAFELLFNIHAMLRKKGLRDAFELTFFAPMPKPGIRMGERAYAALDSMLASSEIGKRIGTKITGFDERGVAFQDGFRLDADLVVFIPGAAGHRVPGRSGLPVNEAGFVRIDDHGLVEGTRNVYAIGDVVALEGPDWRARQGHTAEAMARNAAHNITMDVSGRGERRGYRDHLSIVCLVDTGTSGALVYRDARRERFVRLPVVGHWMKRAWGGYARLTKTGRMPRIPGL